MEREECFQLHSLEEAGQTGSLEDLKMQQNQASR